MNFDNYLNPPEVEDIMIECDNERCARGHVSWEDADKDLFENWVCIWCQDDGYKSAEQINYDCDLDDDEIVKRTRFVSEDVFVNAGVFNCPSCEDDKTHTEILHLFYVPGIDKPVMHTCACHKCNQLFWVTPERGE